MGDHNYSRRDVLRAITVLKTGQLLPLNAGTALASSSGVIRGSVRDAATGRPAAAKMRVIDTTTGQPLLPASAIKTMPKTSKSGLRYFYVEGNYEIAVHPARYRIEVVRGICHKVATIQTQVESGTVRFHDFNVEPLRNLHADNWYSGNTHTHYNVDLEEEIDQRARAVPPAEDLDVSVLSYLIRGKLPYPSNRIPIGRLPQFSKDDVLMDMGEECRNNKPSDEIGYGHCLFLDIPRLVEPVSTGMLSPDGKAPDYPTLSMLCAEARKLGGTTVWCHNGNGMETPVAIALGHVNALNVADGAVVDYDWYYRLLNCGLRLPISSGTDWWEYDHNRVFVQVRGAFNYDSWLEGLRAGRTFVTNGPLLEFSVNGQQPGAVIRSQRVKVVARVLSRVPFERIEIVQDGAIVASQTAAGQRQAKIECELTVHRSGWIAARVDGNTATQMGYPVFAHSGPVYVEAGAPSAIRSEAASAMAAQIEESMKFIRKNYKFTYESDAAIALGQFNRGRDFFATLVD